MTVSDSLFVDDDRGALAAAAGWITDLLSGSAATSLCIIAVAALGLLILSGRLALRRGGEVVAGCFLLLGAGAISSGLQGLGDDLSGNSSSGPLIIEREPPPQQLPPSTYNPYAGASLRRK